MSVSNTHNFASVGKLVDESSGNGSVNLELFTKDATGDAEDLWHFLSNLFESLLIQENIVIELILNLSLSPRLLLGLGSLGFLGLGTRG